MNAREQQLLDKLGIIVTSLRYEQARVDMNTVIDETLADVNVPVNIRGEFKINEERFRPMCRLIELTDMICESKNPSVNKMFDHLVTMLELTKEERE